VDDERAAPEGTTPGPSAPPQPDPAAPQPVRADSPAVAPAADAVAPPLGQAPRRRTLFGRVRKPRKARQHPYRDELSPEAERKLDPRRVTLAWAALALLLVGGGYFLASRYSPHVPGAAEPVDFATWDLVLQVPLFTGIALLGASFLKGPWARRMTQAGWLIGALYGGLWAQDLFYENAADYVNAAFSVLFGVLFVYLAYHEWLSRTRGVENAAVRFLGISWFVGAGAYFLIDKVQPVRLWLIHVVSDHTKWMLDLFGQGDKAGLVFLVDETDNKSPTTFFYPDQYCDPHNPSIPNVSQWCAEHGLNVPAHIPDIGSSFWDQLLYIAPDGDLYIKPVSIILACTALQSIMVFVGLFAGTVATWQKRLRASLIVGAVIYVLNLVRNTGIIWFYGQGHASFWVMHDAIGKGGSLAAMILIAFGVFRWFPEFFTALTGVLDLVDRDGPIERGLKIGKRRPEATTATVPTPS
jgi:exosortase/archaeosortase family protein